MRRKKGDGCLYRRPDSPVWWMKYSRNGQLGFALGHEIWSEMATPKRVLSGNATDMCYMLHDFSETITC
jgi:hypothetical protein